MMTTDDGSELPPLVHRCVFVDSYHEVEWETEREQARDIGTQAHRHTGTQAHRQTHRHTDTQADRHTGRQTHR